MRPPTDNIKTNGMARTNDLSVLTHRKKDSLVELGLVIIEFIYSHLLNLNIKNTLI
jgi:hypothetical protein